MIQTGLKIKNLIDFIKEYLNIIIILPALFGGLWQLFELWCIAPSFIRFFSISQIVPDGLFILFLLIYCSLPFLVAHMMHSTIFYTDKSTFQLLTIPLIQDKKLKLRIYTLCFFLLSILCIIFFGYFSFVDDSQISTIGGLMGAMWIIAFCNLFLNICYNTASPEWKYNYKLCNLLLLVMYFTIIAFTFKKVHKNQLPVVSIINIENITSQIKNKYPETNNEILYYNDKFIFFKIVDNSKIDKETKKAIEKIEIVKLDDLFTK